MKLPPPSSSSLLHHPEVPSIHRKMSTENANSQQPPPIPPAPQFDSDALSRRSSSSHALDSVLTSRSSSSKSTLLHSQNPADDLHFINIRLPNVPQYKDIDSEKVFGKSDAKRYREQSWGHMIYTIIRGRAMPVKQLLATVLWTTIAVLITWATSRNYNAKNGPCRWWCTPLAVDGDALSYVGFALFLLTSFRVQEAYSRYMEAVRVWTNIGGTITSFTQYIVQAFPAGMFHSGDRERILSFLVAFPVALKRQLRKEKDLRELKDVLTRSDLAELQNAPDMPAHCLYMLSAYCMHATKMEQKFPQTFIVHLIRWIADLAGAADTCTQIKTMPAPYSYITHLNTFLALWLFFLPFALVESTGWGTILIVAFISYGILGVVTNAAELEDPFGSDFNDLPLGRFAQDIQNSVADIYHALKEQERTLFKDITSDDLTSSDQYWLAEKQD